MVNTMSSDNNAAAVTSVVCESNKTRAILGVLVWTFILNLLTSLGKILVGLSAGLLNVLADGIHSLSDAFVNIVGFVSIKLSGKAPSDTHPYGYQKYETIATLIVGCITFFLFLEIFQAAIKKILNPENINVPAIAYKIMVVSVVLNVITVLYEKNKGKNLKSEFLIADAKETTADIFISSGLIIALYFISKGFYWIDGVLTLCISIIVFKNSWEIFRMATKILVDEAVLNPEDVVDVVTSHSNVQWAHMVRSRGKPDSIYLDIHIGVSPETTVEEAHDVISHEVKHLISEKFPDVKCVTTHIEPDKESARMRANSVFRYKDY